MDLETFEQLLAPDGQRLLAEVAARAGVESDLGLGTRLRRTHEPGLVAAAVTQNHLRGRAAAKFGADAPHLFFTHDALEQSTRTTVATHRASRLAAAGATSVAVSYTHLTLPTKADEGGSRGGGGQLNEESATRVRSVRA
ncbi:SAM-dependent methyltransferase, partial [Aeromicrobium fastidiosum]|nr:SAM-dependent methyltransferase [Aeromicrobium fastidiosum]